MIKREKLASRVKNRAWIGSSQKTSRWLMKAGA
jgi:hypothetical protein